MKIKELFWFLVLFISILAILFLLTPVIRIMTSSSLASLISTILEKEVIKSILLSIYTAGVAASISLFFGLPLAYLLVRVDFPGKKFVDSIINIPIVIPHPVIGIAILSVVGKNYWFGKLLQKIGIQIMGTTGGIITVLTFVSMPFFINASKEGFESVPPRLEKVSRSLGASMWYTFFHITLPIAKSSIFIGYIMAFARALSEFGAVVIVSYHPMVAPVLIYERFVTSGLKYSQPISFWLILISILIFLILRIMVIKRQKQ